MRTARRNVGLASEVARLTFAVGKGRNDNAANDPINEDTLRNLGRDLKVSRHRWKAIKGTASALISASGVDWVSSHYLRDVVLEPE